MKSQKVWPWVVFLLSCGGYVPLSIGAYLHPAELNMSTYSLWAILSVLMTYSAVQQKYPGWMMQFGWLVGNVLMLSVACYMQQFIFNLGMSETIALYGIILVVGVWVTIGKMTGKMDPRILFLGTVFVDMLSFYPQLKQYLLPHEAPTMWLLFGWVMFLFGTFCNLIWVERLFLKLLTPNGTYETRFGETKRVIAIIETSALSIENLILLALTLWIMM